MKVRSLHWSELKRSSLSSPITSSTWDTTSPLIGWDWWCKEEELLSESQSIFQWTLEELFKIYLPYFQLCWRRWRGLCPEHHLLWWKAVSRSPWSNCCCWIVDTSGVQPGFQQLSPWATNTTDFISGHRRSGNIMLIPETAAHLEGCRFPDDHQHQLMWTEFSARRLLTEEQAYCCRSTLQGALTSPADRRVSLLWNTSEFHEHFLSHRWCHSVKVEKRVFARTCWLLNKLW